MYITIFTLYSHKINNVIAIWEEGLRYKQECDSSRRILKLMRNILHQHKYHGLSYWFLVQNACLEIFVLKEKYMLQ